MQLAPEDQVQLKVHDHQIDPALLAQVAAMEVLAFAEPWGAESMRSTLSQPGSALAVLTGALAAGDGEREAAPLAFCLYQQVIDEVSILQLATAPAARRRGYGLRLLRFVQQAAQAAGCAQLFLEVRRGNAAAIALYEAAGFVQAGVRRRYYADNGEDALVLHCPLPLLP
jgi:ribosomal-protein-alanine N-acetyltransferase